MECSSDLSQDKDLYINNNIVLQSYDCSCFQNSKRSRRDTTLCDKSINTSADDSNSDSSDDDGRFVLFCNV